MHKPRIFLCHASEDKQQVEAVYHQLKEAGYHPWLDKYDLLPGQDWRTEIKRIITTADNLIVICLSRSSITKRGTVQREIKWALDVLEEIPEDAIYLIPARLEPCQVPDQLSRLHWVDLYEPDGFENLKRSLDYEIGKRQEPYESELVHVRAGTIVEPVVEHTHLGDVADKGRDLLDFIRKLPGWITGPIALVTAMMGFIKLWQGDAGLVTIVLLLTGIGSGLLGCAYLAFKRAPPTVERGKVVWQYPQWRPWALAGLVIFPLLAAGLATYPLFVVPILSSTTVSSGNTIDTTPGIPTSARSTFEGKSPDTTESEPHETATPTYTLVPQPISTLLPLLMATPIPVPTHTPSPSPSNAFHTAAEGLEYIEGEVLFEDDFEDGKADGWLISQGWNVEQDETGNYLLRLSPLGNYPTQAVAGARDWRDYALDFRAKIIEPAPQPSELDINLRVNWDRPDCKRYLYHIGTTGSWLGRDGVHLGVEDPDCPYTPLGQHMVALAEDTWYQIRLELYGSRITVYLDGQQLLTVDDEAPILAGQFILAAPSGATVYYDDVRVVELIPASQSLGEPVTPNQHLQATIHAADSNPSAKFGMTALQAAASRAPTLEDDFSDPSSGYVKRRNGESFVRYEDGVYLMEGQLDTCCVNSDLVGSYADFVLQLDMRIDASERKADSFGAVSLRQTPAGFYAFHLKYRDLEPGYSLGYDLEGTDYTELAGGPLPDSLDITTLEEWHNLTAVLVGDKMAFFVDGMLIVSITDDTLSQGGIALYPGWGSTVQVDNLRVWDISDLRPTDQTTHELEMSAQHLEAAIRAVQSDPQVTFAEAALQAAASRAPTLEDDFSDPSSGFGQFQREYGISRYENGVYLMESSQDACCAKSNVVGGFTDLVVQLDMRIDIREPHLPFSGVLSVHRTPAGYYKFELRYEGSKMGYWMGYHLGSSEVGTLASGLLPAGLDTTADDWHNLVVVIDENQMAYFVDGTLVASGTDDNLEQGGVAVFAGWSSAVRVDNLRIWDVSDLP